MAGPADLIFTAPPATGLPARLSFDGPDDDAPRVLQLVFSAAPATGLPARLVFGDESESETPPVASDSVVTLASRITFLSGTVSVRYSSETSRPLTGQVASHWQRAQPSACGVEGQYQQSRTMASGARTAWQDGVRRSAGVHDAWFDASRAAQGLRSRYQQALPIQPDALRALWQQAQDVRVAVRSLFEQARPLPTVPSLSRFQETIHLRSGAEERWQRADPRRSSARAWENYGLPMRTSWAVRYQEAWPPRPGRWPGRPPKPPVGDACYVPGLPVELVFSEPGSGGVLPPLVFVCERRPPGLDPEPGATVVVPIRKFYMTLNNVTLIRVDGAVPIPAYSFGMSIDVDSWTWQWQATLHADALALIQPGPGGDPVDVLATINGTPYRLAVENFSRQRQFGQTRIAVKGRGRAAILDAPYAPVGNHGNAAARTAQQLMADVLTVNGVGIGWDVDWRLTDWLVPGNAWAHQGSYIGAILDIAGAAGGYVQPHNTLPTLRVLPRYPAAPWQWATLTPDFELPSAVVSVEGIDWQRKAAYDRVFVSGANASGVLGQVTRGGTAGGSVAPMVTHPLITHADAARQRGIAELGDTGRQAHISLRLPVLAETGVIQPGALVRYVDGGDTHLGLVRGTSVDWTRPTLRQTLSVETHPA